MKINKLKKKHFSRKNVKTLAEEQQNLESLLVRLNELREQISVVERKLAGYRLKNDESYNRWRKDIEAHDE